MTAPPNQTEAPSADAVRRCVVIANRLGLHARAAAKFVKTAGAYDAEVEVVNGAIAVSGLSIMGLMMLAAGPGCEIDLIARGRQAQEVIDALTAMIVSKFDED